MARDFFGDLGFGLTYSFVAQAETRSPTWESDTTVVDAVIFDIDGTLWGRISLERPRLESGLGLAKLGIPGEASAEEMSKVTGGPIEECVDILLPGMRAKHPHLLDTLRGCEEVMVGRAGGWFHEGSSRAATILPIVFASHPEALAAFGDRVGAPSSGCTMRAAVGLSSRDQPVQAPLSGKID